MEQFWLSSLMLIQMEAQMMRLWIFKIKDYSQALFKPNPNNPYRMLFPMKICKIQKFFKIKKILKYQNRQLKITLHRQTKLLITKPLLKRKKQLKLKQIKLLKLLITAQLNKIKISQLPHP